jgi:hypothetical protein
MITEQRIRNILESLTYKAAAGSTIAVEAIAVITELAKLRAEPPRPAADLVTTRVGVTYNASPRRFRFPIPAGEKHPANHETAWQYGCYWPMTDLVTTDMGIRRTGIPRWPGIEWIDGIDDLPWAEPARAAEGEAK